jgi:hypothetical protein
MLPQTIAMQRGDNFASPYIRALLTGKHHQITSGMAVLYLIKTGIAINCSQKNENWRNKQICTSETVQIDKELAMEKKIRIVRAIHRTCVCATAVGTCFYWHSCFDGFFLENGSFFVRLGLWLIMGVMVTSVPLVAVGFLLHCAAFYKDAKPREHTTFRNKMLFGRTYYPGGIDDEISAGIRFAIIIGYVEAGILIFELL